MSILKRKIKACQQALENRKTGLMKLNSSIAQYKVESPPNHQNVEHDQGQPKKRKRLAGASITPRIYLQAKNIVTNFGKAIATFAMSDLALPYLITELRNKGFDALIQPQDFFEFVKNSKGSINSIGNLRHLLLIEEKDSAEIIACKKCFQVLAEIFIKCFSVNWIINGRVTYKLEHLKFRYRMLRRIRNPESFTYLKGYHYTQSKSPTN